MRFSHFEFDPENDLLGEGPLSEVYKATDLDLGRTVALKILRAHAEIDPQADTRFLREAKHTSNLAHSNITTIFEYGQDQGTSFIAMEYLQGRTLDRILKDRSLSIDECLRIARQVTAALALVHQQGLVHRDLKPGNIMVQDDGNVKLLDFGIARKMDDAAITQHGMLVGTVLFMSPEQVRGEEFDVRSDVFSLGSVLYNAVTGTLPFPGRSFPEVCMAILDGNPRRPSLVRSGIPKPFEEFILHCLESDPVKRFRNATEAHGALLTIGSNLSSSNGVQAANLRARILLQPLDCGGGSPCEALAGSLRKDLASELARVKGVTVVLPADDELPSGDGFDYVLHGELTVEGEDGGLELRLERWRRSTGDWSRLEAWEERVEAHDANEWGLQASLVRSATRAVRRRLAELSVTPSASVERDTETGRAWAARAHDVLHRGTTKHLMAAISSFRRAIDADPYCAIAFAGMAEAMVRKYLYWDGDASFIEESREYSARALALDQGCAEAHTSLGFAFHLSGHTTDAQREYRAAIQLDKDEWLAHRLLGAILVREGNFKEAAALLNRAIALKPTHIGSYNHLFIVLQRLDRYEESLERADRGIQAAKAHLKEVPDNQEARTHLAMLLARIGLADEAREHARAAFDHSPKDGYTSFHVGIVYSILGDHEEAIEALASAVARGFFVKNELTTSGDFEVLRGLDTFQKLLQ